MTLQEIQKSIIEEFSVYDDWMDKYEYIIELGKELKPIDESLKTEDNLVRGCTAKVWLHGYFKDGKIYFEADSDAIITKGLVGLMTRVLSGQTPQEILDCELEFIETIGLREHLSPTRSNGLIAMIKKMKSYALAYSVKK